MIAVNKLKAAIVESGLTQGEVAREIGLTDRGFRYRLKKGKFYNTEIEKLISILPISDPMGVFFADKVTR